MIKVFVNSSRPDTGQREKTNLSFYFHTSSWNAFEPPQRSAKKKNLS